MSLLHTVVTEPAVARLGTIVAIPGLIESARALNPTARHWAGRGLRVLAIDPRGHGGSPRWSSEQLARHPGDVIVEDILTTMRQALADPGEPLVLFGHSAGGAAAAAVAVAWSGKVAAVVLEDPFWRLPVTQFQDGNVAVSAAANLRRMKAQSEAERIAEIKLAFPGWPEDELAEWSKSKDDMDVSLVENGHVIPTRPWPTLLRDLSKAKVPVLVITGTVRIGVTANHRAIIRSEGAEVIIVPRASHFIRRDARPEFHRLVDQFLDQVI